MVAGLEGSSTPKQVLGFGTGIGGIGFGKVYDCKVFRPLGYS